MEKYFVCLANSKKYQERCLAGIEIVPNFARKYYTIARRDEKPVWIRPVSENKFGQVDSGLVGDIHLMDIVKLNVLKDYPKNYQTENALFDPDSIEVVGHVPHKVEFLDRFLHPDEPLLFGTKDKCISINELNGLDYSLIFIQPSSVSCYKRHQDARSQARMKFLYNSNQYDLPITDLNFCEKFDGCPKILDSINDLFLTISLGQEFHGKHWKLISGVLWEE